MMLARNNLERDFDKAKRLHREEKASLESQIAELQKLSSDTYISKTDDSRISVSPLLSPKVNSVVTADNTLLKEEKQHLEVANQTLTIKLQEADEQIFQLTTELHLSQSQHSREVQDLKLAAQRNVSSESFNNLRLTLEKQQSRCKELEEAIKIRSTEGSKLLLGMYGTVVRIRYVFRGV